MAEILGNERKQIKMRKMQFFDCMGGMLCHCHVVTANKATYKNMKNKQTKYIIRATYYFYAGTFHAPKNGDLRFRENNNRLEFNSREDAVKYLTAMPTLTPFGYSDAMGCDENADGSYSSAGTYHTAHGEYSRPVYRIRKITL
jgi:hypothetical protein